MADYSIKILADIKDAQKNIEGFTKTTTNLFKTGLGVGLAIAAFDKLADAMAAPVREALEADKNLQQLNLSLKLAGDFSDEASQGFQDMASSLQATTTVSDDAALSAISLAKNLGLTNEETEKTVKAAANLAAVTGVDLNTATQALSKSLEGQGGQLSRLLPQVKGLTEEQLRNGAALDFVTKRFDGAAQAMAKTFGGAIDQSTNLFSDLLETIGGFIVQSPVVVLLINAAGKAFQALNEFLTANR